MRGVVWRVFLCGVIVGVAMGAAHEQRWGLFTWLLVTAALGAYTAWDHWRKIQPASRRYAGGRLPGP
jgi:hypothetical protein